MKKKSVIKGGPKGSAKIDTKVDKRLEKKLDKKAAAKAHASKVAKPSLKSHKAPKLEAKKKLAKAPAKTSSAKKAPVALPGKIKKAMPLARPVVLPKKGEKSVKPEKAPVKGAKEKDLKETKTPLVTKTTVAPSKKEAKAVAKKGRGAPAKKNEEEVEDDFIADDDLGNDDIGEYEEELKAVETLDEEAEEIVEWSQDGKEKGDEEIYLTDAEGRRYCRARDCDQAAVVDTYCRYHYLLFWRKIQVRKRILLDGKLEHYIEELTARYPDKFLEMIRRDLRTEKDFLGAIQELEIDEAGLDNEMEEDTQSYIEEVRGIGEGSGSGVEDEEF